MDKKESFNQNNLLYSLPTIENKLCEIKQVTGRSASFITHEDNWRQIEFINNIFQDKIQIQITEIDNIYRDFRKGIGFEKVYVRNLIEDPFDGIDLSLERLKEELQITSNGTDFSFYNESVAVNGFCFILADRTIIYGVTQNNQVKYLCLENCSTISNGIKSFARKYNLTIVDWRKMTVIK
jgi:hypothetical protein